MALIEVEFATGARLRIGRPIDAATVSAAITALASGGDDRLVGRRVGVANLDSVALPGADETSRTD